MTDEADRTVFSQRSFQGALLDDVPVLVMYDSAKDKAVMIDREHPFYAKAMAAISILEMAFAPVLQENPQKKTLLHVDRPKLIRGLHS